MNTSLIYADGMGASARQVFDVICALRGRTQQIEFLKPMVAECATLSADHEDGRLEKEGVELMIKAAAKVFVHANVVPEYRKSEGLLLVSIPSLSGIMGNFYKELLRLGETESGYDPTPKMRYVEKIYSAIRQRVDDCGMMEQFLFYLQKEIGQLAAIARKYSDQTSLT